MERDEQRQRIMEFFQGQEPAVESSLGDALYSMSELGCWPDYVDSVSEEQALLCWRIVEKLRIEEFPKALRM